MIMRDAQPTAVRFLNPASMPPANGYTQVAEVTGSKIVYISGQVAIDRAGHVVGAGDLRAQTQQIFENLQAGLAAVGATFDHVVKLQLYLLDITQIQIVRDVRDRFVNTQLPPASTAVEVRRLVRDEFLIEIDAIAALPQKENRP
jgi:enamine deaminase RidA (YjgF/YER057c/UK114 family)